MKIGFDLKFILVLQNILSTQLNGIESVQFLDTYPFRKKFSFCPKLFCYNFELEQTRVT
jgi:hypothetical protein